MRALAIVHQSDAGPGVFAEAAREFGASLDEWLLPEDRPPADPFGYDAVMTFGGAMHVDQEQEHPWLVAEERLLAGLLEREVPLLGVCLGAELLAAAAGATVRRASAPEIGWYEVRPIGPAQPDPLLGPLAAPFEALEWHSYEFSLPPGATALAESDACLQAYRVGDRAWGIQFHAEVTGDALDSWIDDYRSDPDALTIDPEHFRSSSRSRMEQWNGLGRELCGRFLAAARR
jgi:GMP synthase-like glutamine amidotransferase